jgi:hypothetical protein
MRRNQRGLFWLGISILAVLTLSAALLVQASPDSEAVGPVITDWSTHHVIFSRPATEEVVERLERDPRYWQQLRRQSPLTLPEVETESDSASTLQSSSDVSSQGKNHALGRDWAEDMGGSATVGAGNYPAKFSFNPTTASCATDFVVFSTGNLGSAPGKPGILAYNNLYSGCTAPVPAVYWAFNTGGQIKSSTTLSRTGTEIAFVQTTGGGVSDLALLKWKASRGTVASPAVPAFASNPIFPSCPAPCMTTLPLVDSSVAARDSNSSPFYDYANDALYVGDDSGYLHKFTPVFNAVPKEVTTGGWPVKVNSSAPTALTNPVLDSVTGNVFVEDKGGYLYRVNSTGAATPTQSGLLDHSTALDVGPGMVQGPIVDSGAGLVYVFATSDGSLGCGGVDCTVIYQVTTSFAANVVPVSPEKVDIGSSTAHGIAPNPLYIGTFDSTYQSSANPPTGNLYVCGDTGGNAILYRVPITAGSFGTVTPIVATTAAANHRTCAPVSDVSNPNTSVGTMERVFFGVANSGLPTLCAGGGCALSFVDTPWKKGTHYNVGQEILVLRADNTPWINVAILSGTTAAAQPTWPAGVGAETIDGTVIWLNQGATTLTPLASWVANQVNALQARIVDDNGNVEIVAVPGTSGAGPAAPNWNTTAGGLTVDGTVTWINAGVLPSAALASSAGTSGFIIDNVVGSGVQVGASQVYFSTLANQACTGGTGGCAVQASQSALQ